MSGVLPVIFPAFPKTTLVYEPPEYWTAISKSNSVPKISPSSLNLCKAGTVIVIETASTSESVICITFGVDWDTVEKPVGFVVSTFFCYWNTGLTWSTISSLKNYIFKIKITIRAL